MLSQLPPALRAFLGSNAFCRVQRGSGGPLRYSALALLVLSSVGSGWATSVDKRAELQINPNATTYVWTIEDTYQGQTFFEYVLPPVTARCAILCAFVQHISILH